jgi:hypothetical protein
MRGDGTSHALAVEESLEADQDGVSFASDGRFTSERGRALAKRQRLAMSDLPLYLEKVTGRGLRVLDAILKLPLDEENGPLIRAQVTAALGVVSSQLRADEARLKRKATGDALARLLKVIARQSKLIESGPDSAQKALAVNLSAEGADSADLGDDASMPVIERLGVSRESNEN